MLKEAIEKIKEMSNESIRVVVDGQTFVKSGGEFVQLRKELDIPYSISLSSLDAIVKMVKTEGVRRAAGKSPIYIEAKSADSVTVFVQPDPDNRNIRLEFYSANAIDIPGWNDEVTMPFDKAAVALQTRFQDGGDREYTMQLLSQITTGAHVTYNDTGIATTIVSSKGVSLQQNATIKPIVTLRPYRTFQEIEQPAGRFLIRINERGITFTEADGGMWKLTARKSIVEYFSAAFKDEIEAGEVVVML